jgi:O-methyltransferase
MTDVTLKDLTPQQMLAIADAAYRAGNSRVALDLYRSLRRWNPANPNILSRLILCRYATSRAPIMLDALCELERMSPASVYIGEGIATWLKRPPFMEDPRFLEIVEKHLDLSPQAVGWHWNLSIALWAVARSRELPGDLVELGVFKGHTTLFVAEYLSFATWPKCWWLYDTFAGIPDDQRDPGWDKVNEAQYAGKYSFEEVRDRFASFPNITVTQGRVPEVLEATCPERISFLHLDLNNAAAEVGALDALYDRVSPGAAILFDDYIWLTAKAQYEAERAWFAARGLAVLPLPTGQGLFIKP